MEETILLAISEETGLSVDKVAEVLNSYAKNALIHCVLNKPLNTPFGRLEYRENKLHITDQHKGLMRLCKEPESRDTILQYITENLLYK